MERRSIIVSFLAGCLWLCLGLFPFSQALALTPIQLSDLSYERCPAEMQGIVTSGSNEDANCFMIKAKRKTHRVNILLMRMCLGVFMMPMVRRPLRIVVVWAPF